MHILTNRSYLRRLSDCEFAQFVSIPFSGSGHCGEHGDALGVSYRTICAVQSMGTDTMPESQFYQQVPG